MHIYAIRNKKTGRKYIGGTRNFKRRWASHKQLLKTNTHCNKPLQKDWIKYGKETFEFIILEVVENSDLLIHSEQKWMDATKLKYNLCKMAGSPLGFKQSKGNNILDSVELKDNNTNGRLDNVIRDFCKILDTYYPMEWQVKELRQLIQEFANEQVTRHSGKITGHSSDHFKG
jgi:group I intron endonuclease